MKELEEKLIEKAQNGEAVAFGRLYDEYIEPIYRFVYLKVGHKADAEDITQQVFLSAWQNIGNYRFQGFPFSSWLYKIAHNAVIDHYRIKSNHPQIELEAAAEIVGETDTDSKIDKNFELKLIKNAIRKLPPDQQSIVIMKFVEELSNKEVAKILDKTEGAIRVIQHRALKQLKKYLDESGYHSTTKEI